MATSSTSNTSSTSSTDPLAQYRQSTSSKTTATEDSQTRFLTMLTTQLKNQDPLNPMDNAQMTSQLAQINTVTGIEKLNSTLQTLLGAYQTEQSLSASNMLDKQVLVPGDDLNLSKGKAQGGFDLAGPADRVKVTITGKDGREIAALDLGAKDEAGSYTFDWDGKDSQGNAVADGAYTIKVEATRGTEKVNVTALEVGTVSALIKGTKGFTLEMADGSKYSYDDVRQIL